MDKQDWYDMGAQIGDLVQSAIDSKNFRQLNQTITDTIRTTAEMVQKNKASGENRLSAGGGEKSGAEARFPQHCKRPGREGGRGL